MVDSEILHGGEGGVVERWLEPQNKSFFFAIARTSEQIFLFVISLLSLFTCLSFIYSCRSILISIRQQLSTSILSRRITRRSLEPFTGNPASSLILSDRLYYFILNCLEFLFDQLYTYSPPVAPRSDGYGDATATYIRRAMLPSRMYAKHQYNTIQGSECENTWYYTFQYKIVQVLIHHRL